MFDLKSIVSRFSDYFDKQPTSNISKLMRIFSDELVALNSTITKVGDWRDIDNAKGVALDDIGTNINQPRGVATDDIYRILLKSKIARNLSDGSINTIIRVLAIALSCDYSEIKIKEKWDDDLDPEEAAIKVIEMPLDRLNDTGLDPINFARIVQRTVAGGVKVDVIELTGTFELGDANANDNYDKFHGLGDINNPDIGGYLGAAFTPATDQELPI